MLSPLSRVHLHDSSVRGIPQAKILEWVAISSSRDLPNPGIEPESPGAPALTGGFFTTESLGEPLLREEGLSEK